MCMHAGVRTHTSMANSMDRYILYIYRYTYRVHLNLSLCIRCVSMIVQSISYMHTYMCLDIHIHTHLHTYCTCTLALIPNKIGDRCARMKYNSAEVKVKGSILWCSIVSTWAFKGFFNPYSQAYVCTIVCVSPHIRYNLLTHSITPPGGARGGHAPDARRVAEAERHVGQPATPKKTQPGPSKVASF